MPQLDTKTLLCVANAYSEICFCETIPYKLRESKLKAVNTAVRTHLGYMDLGIRDDLIDTIIDKRLKQICSATAIAQLNQICSPKPPRYNGAKFVPSSEYSIPEEELIGWSQASLKAPLVNAGFDRYSELFKQVFGALPAEPCFGELM